MTKHQTNSGNENGQAAVHLELTPSAKDQLSKVAERTGMTQSAVLCRLLEWFVDQDEPVQADAMGHFHNMERTQIIEMIVKKLANGAGCVVFVLVQLGAFFGDAIAALAA